MSSLTTSLDTLFAKMDGFVSSKTVVGEPIRLDNMTVIPLVDVAFGVGAGASEKSGEKNKGDTCGGGLGAKITPAAVIIVRESGIQLVSVKSENSINKLIDMAPGILDRLSFRKGSGKKVSDEEMEVFEDERISE